ncbi:hypothetical protein ACFFMP_08700 [Pseudoroseomonas cervicalis]|uniref:hypothetical protein n=1 Tax=Teichococcus cervicalis TaxID=204525 RepID=UPI0035EDBEE1
MAETLRAPERDHLTADRERALPRPLARCGRRAWSDRLESRVSERGSAAGPAKIAA